MQADRLPETIFPHSLLYAGPLPPPCSFFLSDVFNFCSRTKCITRRLYRGNSKTFEIAYEKVNCTLDAYPGCIRELFERRRQTGH